MSGQLHAPADLPSVQGSPPIRQSRSGRVQCRESELQKTDHEMIPAGGGSRGGSGVEISGALMGLLYVGGTIGLLLMVKKVKFTLEQALKAKRGVEV